MNDNSSLGFQAGQIWHETTDWLSVHSLQILLAVCGLQE